MPCWRRRTWRCPMWCAWAVRGWFPRMPSPVLTGAASARWRNRPGPCAPGHEPARQPAPDKAKRHAIGRAVLLSMQPWAGLFVSVCRAFELLAAALNVLAEPRHRVATGQQSGKQNAPDPTFLHAGLLF
ncbi:protein of unknown function (plasmid) [Cupriavidus taiwanensis]|uniref:Transposase n=1 Tax=Cupriavidus taiwanensis TaxID=164546 RepID=A0A375IJY1_9BURK|nr:protein of unknown function [Cupriavidus taiwanensis]